MLRSRWELARQGEGQVVLVTGQAGIGKSRLVTAFVENVSDSGLRAQFYQCSLIHGNTALHPLISRVMRDAQIKLTDPPAEKLEKLGRLVRAELVSDESM